MTETKIQIERETDRENQRFYRLPRQVLLGGLPTGMHSTQHRTALGKACGYVYREREGMYKGHWHCLLHGQ